MNLETFVNQFGYIALIFGLVIEGETILIVAAFLAHRGHMELAWIILIGVLVEFLSDQFFFWLGYTKGYKFLDERPKWGQHAEKAKTMLDRNANFLFLTFQFIYGLRMIIPFVCGMNKINYKKFVLLNLIGVVIWTLFYGLAGYLFGHVVETILKDVEKYELWIILGLAVVGSMIWLIRKRNRERIVEVDKNE